MKEQEYINATNRVKVSAALALLRDAVVMKDSVLYTSEFAEVKSELVRIEQALWSTFSLEDSE